MPAITWNDLGERYFETGVDRGVLYPVGGEGIPWNGLISVKETPSGGDATPYYLDGIKYANRPAIEEFEGTIEAYTYPDEFALCDGTEAIPNAQGLFATQQVRSKFGLSYRTQIGNDTEGPSHGYKLHLIYNALAEPTEKSYSSESEEVDPSTFSWKFTTTPIPIPGITYSAHMVIDTRKAWPWAVEAVENVLYGTEDTPSRLPEPQEIMDLFIENALLKVTDNGDGTVTISGPDEAIYLWTTGQYKINWPSVVINDVNSFNISPL